MRPGTLSGPTTLEVWIFLRVVLTWWSCETSGWLCCLGALCAAVVIKVCKKLVQGITKWVVMAGQQGTALVVCYGLNAFPHTVGVGVFKVSLNALLLSPLGFFQNSFSILSGHCCKPAYPHISRQRLMPWAETVHSCQAMDFGLGRTWWLRWWTQCHKRRCRDVLWGLAFSLACILTPTLQWNDQGYCSAGQLRTQYIRSNRMQASGGVIL